MKLHINDGNILKIDEEAKLEILNLNKFLEILNDSSKNIPSPHFVATLEYKLTVNSEIYLGSITCDSYNGFTNKMDINSPYNVELVNFKLGESTEDKYLEFKIEKK